MAVELRRWSRVNEQEAQDGLNHATLHRVGQPCQCPQCPRVVASEGVRLQYRGSCRWCRRPAVRLLAPTGSGAHACPGSWQMRCASRWLVGLDGIDSRPVAPDPRCQCQSFWGRTPPDAQPRPCRSPPGACPSSPTHLCISARLASEQTLHAATVYVVALQAGTSPPALRCPALALPLPTHLLARSRRRYHDSTA